ncbi:MAG: N-acetylmuramoyl-L-alanine amidase [Gammaproteobacteria bacterium]|nr:N-acetylmuramoyl-L-alanine amidase [Gammaproteobacteria bacterium]
MRSLFLLLGLATANATLTACGPLRIIDVPAEVQSERIDHLVIHFTGESYAESMRLLTQRTNIPVSAHYLIPAPDDSTHPRRELRVHRLVDETQRAWHAGRSYWAGSTSLNARSIGIEIVNTSRCTNIDPDLEPSTPANQHCEFRDFPPEQIELVVTLALDILERNPNIDPEDVVGHGDIAPDRRIDPGPTFPWHTLYEHGIGAWPDDDTVAAYRARFESAPPDGSLLQRALGAYGYEIEETGEIDPQTQFVLRAFQAHFRPSNWSGQPDAGTAAILFALIEKYRPDALEDDAELARVAAR